MNGSAGASPGVLRNERIFPAQEEPTTSIIDAHLHLATASMFQRLRARPWPLRPQARDALMGETGRVARRFAALEGLTVADHAAAWKAAFDKAGVATGVFIAIGEGNEELAEFIRLAPDRFQAWGSVMDPTAPDAAATVRRFSEWGLRGLKLYPPVQRFQANDRALYPVYEAAAAQGLPVLYHFGITVAPIYDLTYANPLPLSSVARDFPEITFGIAHCGAGFLREALFLAYHTENIWTDTSGTNNWREFTPGAPGLDQVFRDLLRAYGPGRILFGTDSTSPAEYREAILREQQQIFTNLEVSEQDLRAIFEGNARRVLRLA
ncbi:MAG TPA: amidohydrolase family protein [bacterium]|nr:amidohydrolase family protein [bacterium]